MIYWNPCGKAVDMGRRPYTTWVRPFRNSDIKVKIRWYPARPEDGTLPYTSKICSLDWHTRPETVEGVGEIWGESRNYNRAKPIPGEKRTHVCGDRFSHMFGGILEPGRPLQQYQPSGLPLCCEPGRREADIRVRVAPESRAITGPVYRSTVALTIRPQTYTVRSPVYRTHICTCARPGVSRVIRSDPYRSTVCACAEPESLALVDDPYRGEAFVFARPESVAFTGSSTTCPLIMPECDWAMPGTPGYGCAYGFETHVWPGPGPDPGPTPTPVSGWLKWNVTVGHTYEFRMAWTRAPRGGTGTWQLFEGDCLDMETLASGVASDLTVTHVFTATESMVLLTLNALTPPTASKVLVLLTDLS